MQRVPYFFVFQSYPPGSQMGQRNFERAAESKQFAPESEQEVPGGQRLYQLRGDVPGVSEAGSRHPRVGAVEEQYGSAFAGERIGDGRADHARTHHCHGVIAYHLSNVYVLHPTYTFYIP